MTGMPVINFHPICSKQGHLTRFLSYGLGLDVTTIEADLTLVEMASKFDRQLELALEKERQKRVGALLDLGGCCFLNVVML